MIIVNNGSRKTGTYWIQRGLHRTLSVSDVPKEYQDRRFKNSSLCPDQFHSFVSSHDNQNIYYSKSHYLLSSRIGNEKAKDALTQNGVLLINSIRNVGDCLVSYYHHMMRQTHEEIPFDRWFESDGRGFVKQYASHHTGWHSVTEPFLFSFENMKHRPSLEFIRFFEHTHLKSTCPLDSEFDKWMSFESQSKDRPTEHLRRGRIGDSMRYLDANMREEIKAVLSRFSFFEKMDPVLRRHNISVESLLV